MAFCCAKNKLKSFTENRNFFKASYQLIRCDEKKITKFKCSSGHDHVVLKSVVKVVCLLLYFEGHQSRDINRPLGHFG